MVSIFSVDSFRSVGDGRGALVNLEVVAVFMDGLMSSHSLILKLDETPK